MQTGSGCAAGTFAAAAFAAGTFLVVAFAFTAGTFAAGTFGVVAFAFATTAFATGTFLVFVAHAEILGQRTGVQIIGLKWIGGLVGRNGCGSERCACNGADCGNELRFLKHFNSLQQH